MQTHEEWLASLNPFEDISLSDAFALIKRHKVDVLLCFVDLTLESSRSEMLAVVKYFDIKDYIWYDRYDKFPLEPYPELDREFARGKNILVWLATHFDGSRFFTQAPNESSWTTVDFYRYLIPWSLIGYKEMFIFMNVCYSRAFSKVWWGSFVDMQGGMTLADCDRHFFMHRHMTEIADQGNAVQQLVRSSDCNTDDAARVRGALEATSATSKSSDHDLHYVFVKKP